jgi:hypothetical protein
VAKRPSLKTEGTTQIALRLPLSEKELMDKLIAHAEEKAGMYHGTITAAAYARSALLEYMAKQLQEIEEEAESKKEKGPTVWDWIRRGPEILPIPGSTERKGRKQ